MLLLPLIFTDLVPSLPVSAIPWGDWGEGRGVQEMEALKIGGIVSV